MPSLKRKTSARLKLEKGIENVCMEILLSNACFWCLLWCWSRFGLRIFGQKKNGGNWNTTFFFIELIRNYSKKGTMIEVRVRFKGFYLLSLVFLSGFEGKQWLHMYTCAFFLILYFNGFYYLMHKGVVHTLVLHGLAPTSPSNRIKPFKVECNLWMSMIEVDWRVGERERGRLRLNILALMCSPCGQH